MTEKIAFDYKRVTKGDVNDHVFDNYGNEYIYENMNNGIMWFKKLEDNDYYTFNKKGEMLNRKDIFLHIEHKTDIKKYKFLMRIFADDKIFYLKITDYIYFIFETGSCLARHGIVEDHENFFRGCHEPNYDDERIMFNRLYELGYGYNREKQEIFPNIGQIHEGKHYVFNNTVFKASHDITYDYRKDNLSIPYEYLVDLDSKKQRRMYENATLGLPRYVCIREATEQEIGQAKEIYERMKVSFQNVERKIIDIKLELEEALRMLDRLKNENGQQG